MGTLGGNQSGVGTTKTIGGVTITETSDGYQVTNSSGQTFNYSKDSGATLTFEDTPNGPMCVIHVKGDDDPFTEILPDGSIVSSQTGPDGKVEPYQITTRDGTTTNMSKTVDSNDGSVLTHTDTEDRNGNTIMTTIVKTASDGTPIETTTIVPNPKTGGETITDGQIIDGNFKSTVTNTDANENVISSVVTTKGNDGITVESSEKGADGTWNTTVTKIPAEGNGTSSTTPPNPDNSGATTPPGPDDTNGSGSSSGDSDG